MKTSGVALPKSARTMRIGMIGIGVGGAEVMPAVDAMDNVTLVAGADIVPATLSRFKERYPESRTYLSARELCEDPEVDAVWVASPNRFHAEHTILAANAGKHVVVEKPMAISLNEAGAMVEAADRNKVKLLAGHTRAFTLPIRAMHRIITSGQYGSLQAVNIWAYSDWMLRPRTADELDPNQGGGVPYRQGPHQIDTVRLLGGGMLRNVRAQTGAWMRERPIPGYYAAFLEFENGLPATIVHNGYGYFVGGELVPWGRDKSIYDVDDRVRLRQALQGGQRDEVSEKQDIRIGGKRSQEYFAASQGPWIPEDMGMAIASLDHADLRQSQYGLFIHDGAGKRDIELMQSGAGGVLQRRAELEELYELVYNGAVLWHDGRWGMATLEACLAMMDSARLRREITLRHQVPVPAGYNDDLPVAGVVGAA